MPHPKLSCRNTCELNRSTQHRRDLGVFVGANLNAILDLAEGRFEAAIDSTGKPWDHAPLVVLVEEAGGRFTDREGGRRIDRCEGRYSNGLVHEALVEALSPVEAREGASEEAHEPGR